MRRLNHESMSRNFLGTELEARRFAEALPLPITPCDLQERLVQHTLGRSAAAE